MKNFQSNPLIDSNFLKLLDEYKEREIYARIIALSFDENPLEQIEGRVTAGSINIDGASAVRRTCTLSLVAQDLDINEFYWGLKNKFKLEIGMRNTIKHIICNANTGETWGDKYPQDIIWFPQGIYAITAFNSTYNATSYTINISGKDKMCFLNGDLGGSLTASIDFGIEEYYDKATNITTYTPVPIAQIIREAVHTYALESYNNIIINDLDEAAIELLEYRGDESTPMYLLRQEEGGFVNYTLNGNTKVYKYNDSKKEKIALKDIKDEDLDKRVELDISENKAQLFVFDTDPKKTPYYIAKIVYGQAVGYRVTDLTYAGELISNIGESITSILDKIKKMLGEYEYFYDIDGKFIFQRKKNYIQNPWNNIVKTGYEVYVENAAYSNSIVYSFDNNKLFTSFSNSPNLSNLKNDYSIWGQRTSISGIKIPVHYRYAIDIKPKEYTSIKITEDESLALIDVYGYPYTPSSENLTSNEILKEKQQKYAQNNVLYSDSKYDWREIIYRMAADHQRYQIMDNFLSKVIEANASNGLYDTGITGYEQYYIDIFSFWRDLYNPEDESGEYNTADHPDRPYWIKTLLTAPDQLNFWFDFLDAESELGQFSVKAIGDRVKAINDTSITAIYFREVPNLIFTNYKDYNESNLKYQSGYTPVFITSGLENLFSISAQGKSAQDAIDELIYNHSYCIESITIQSIPIYYLQPNVRIFVQDNISKISGEYIINKLTIPLAYDGVMSITATKAPERIM